MSSYDLLARHARDYDSLFLRDLHSQDFTQSAFSCCCLKDLTLFSYQVITCLNCIINKFQITSTNPIAVQSSNTGGPVISLILSNDREFSRQSASPPASRSTGIFSYNQGAAPVPWVNYYGEQILPVKHWGRHFVAVTFHSMDVFRIQGTCFS